jgi:hypothetical protein
MSVAINLLPDVRLARIRAQHMRHLVTGIAVAIWIVVGIIVGGLFLGIGAQKLVLSNVNSQIKTDIGSINATPNLNAALTTQQILENLPGLYGGRVYFSKLMPVITAAMPSTLFVSSVTTTTGNAITISGDANSAYTVDQFYEALKASQQVGSGALNFSNVTINDVSKDDTGKTSFVLTTTISSGALHG